MKNIILIAILLLASISLADSYQEDRYDDDKEWADSVRDQSTSMVWQELVAKFSRLEQLEGRHKFNEVHDGLALAARLYIFVSHSMPRLLLKAYLKEASRFKGVLVFKGLPNGSFKELSKLVIDLTSNDNSVGSLENLDEGAMQIDDEVFARFAVTHVPTIILAREQQYAPDALDPPIIYDKITGNVGIKYALEQFSLSGELSKEALEHLNCGRK